MDTEWIGKKFDGKLIVKAVKNADHHYTGKHFQQGFFDLLGAENISAVLFSNAGTLAKFDSMGVAAGFAPPNDSNSVVGKVFSREINDTDYT